MEALSTALRVGTVLLAVAAVVALPLVLRRLAEPDPPPGESGPGYRRLVRPRTVLAHAAVTLVGVLVVLAAVPAGLSPLWWALLAAGLGCAVVDAATTWIPRQLCWTGWALGVVGAVVALLVGAPLDRVLLALLGSGLVTVVFWAVWRWGRGRSIGFGDVRLVPVIGLAAGSLGADGWWLALLLGTGAGAVQAVVRRVVGRRTPMAYGPALVSGPFAAAVLLTALG